MTRTRSNPLVYAIAAILLLALIYLVAGASAMDSSDHANRKHGWLEVSLIVDCISKNGPYMNMKFRDRDGKFYTPCQLIDGRIGLGIFDKHGNNITAYVPKDGSWEQVKNYILQRAARFTGALRSDYCQLLNLGGDRCQV